MIKTRVESITYYQICHVIRDEEVPIMTLWEKDLATQIADAINEESMNKVIIKEKTIFFEDGYQEALLKRRRIRNEKN